MRFNNNEKKRTRKSALTKAVATALTVVTIAGTLTSLTGCGIGKGGHEQLLYRHTRLDQAYGSIHHHGGFPRASGGGHDKIAGRLYIQRSFLRSVRRLDHGCPPPWKGIPSVRCGAA